MATELRNTGIVVVGDVPWGTHICHFYETKEDLLDTLVLYFKAGLESREFCMWLDDAITDQPMTLLCTYPVAKSRAAQILDVVQTHQFAIARRHGEWEVIETPELIRARAEINRLNEDLEERVAERTRELVAANQALRSEIDERSRVEKELGERAGDLAEAQRVAKIGNWTFDLRTNKVFWSAELYRIFEIEKPDFDGRHESFVSRIHPDDQQRVLRSNAQIRIEGLPFEIEYRIITPNEQVKIIREVGYATQDETGQVIRLFGTAQDITERKLVELALDERLRFETLLTELSAAFASLSNNEVDREIDKWLQSLVEFMGVDRGTFFQLFARFSKSFPMCMSQARLPMAVKLCG